MNDNEYDLKMTLSFRSLVKSSLLSHDSQRSHRANKKNKVRAILGNVLRGGAHEIQRNYRLMGARNRVWGATKESSKLAGPGVQGTFRRNSLRCLQKDSCIFFPLHFMYFGPCLQNITRLFMLHIAIYLYPFNSNSHFWCHCLPLFVQWTLGCTIGVGRKPIPFWRFLKHLSQGSILRDMFAFTDNNMMENNLPVNCMTEIKGHSWSTGHCFQELAINTSQQYFRWRELVFSFRLQIFFPFIQYFIV